MSHRAMDGGDKLTETMLNTCSCGCGTTVLEETPTPDTCGCGCSANESSEPTQPKENIA